MWLRNERSYLWSGPDDHSVATEAQRRRSSVPYSRRLVPPDNRRLPTFTNRYFNKVCQALHPESPCIAACKAVTIARDFSDWQTIKPMENLSVELISATKLAVEWAKRGGATYQHSTFSWRWPSGAIPSTRSVRGPYPECAPLR